MGTRSESSPYVNAFRSALRDRTDPGRVAFRDIEHSVWLSLLKTTSSCTSLAYPDRHLRGWIFDDAPAGEDTQSPSRTLTSHNTHT